MTWLAVTEAGRDRSLDHLLARLDLLVARVRMAVDRRRAVDPDPDDRFRGLYVADAQLDALLDVDRPGLWASATEGFTELSDAIESRADLWQDDGHDLRLRRLMAAFEIDLLDVDLLLVALAPDLDPRFERLYGYLHDDVTRRRASIGLALELVGIEPISAQGRARLADGSELIAGGLLRIDDSDRPLLTRSLRVPDRVSGHLVGHDLFEPGIASMLVDLPNGWSQPWEPLDQAIRQGITPTYLHERPGTAAAWTASLAIQRAGRVPLVVEMSHLAAMADPLSMCVEVIREARLRDSVLVAVDTDVLSERAPAAIGRLAEGRCQVVLTGTRPWDPAWSEAVPLVLDVPHPDADERLMRWHAELNGDGELPGLVSAASAFRLTPVQVSRAVAAGRLTARVARRDVEPSDLQAGARAQNAAGLDRLSVHVQPRAGWRDMVLPSTTAVQLREVAARARHRERVYGEWGIGGRASRGRGITALFAGDSGTGKTLASEVIAGDLGLDLYVIDLSTVVDKYIGETEKNLDRIFVEADRVNAVLLFDEADAIFGKRSEVKDARDRYANVEIAFLLQRMERFDGLAVLTTNLRANLDDAFTRRIDVIVDFPMPEDDDRRALWRMHLPPDLPQADDIDLDFLARRFRFSGGNIRNACLTAAFFAAERNGPVTMTDLVRGTEREYRKLGRLTVEDEFGPYLALMAADQALLDQSS